MRIRAAFLAALVSLLIPTLARAEDAFTPPAAVQAPPLSKEALAALNLYVLPGSHFSPNWDSFRSYPISGNFLIRMVYRGSDGLLVGLLEDRNGIVVGQSRSWLIGRGTLGGNVDFTLLVRTEPTWTAELMILNYDRATGETRRYELLWDINTAF